MNARIVGWLKSARHATALAALAVASAHAPAQIQYVQPLAPQAQIVRQDNTDYVDHQIATPELGSFDQCAAACVAESSCRMFTYKDKFKRCYLHGAGSSPTAYPGAMSGVVISRGGQPTAPVAGGIAVLPAPQQSACSIQGTKKCPGCSVACTAPQKAVCEQPSDGILEACLQNSRCECKGG